MPPVSAQTNPSARKFKRNWMEFRKESKTTRKAIIATGLTILFGTAAINAAIIQRFHNAFDVGLRYSNLQNEMAAQAQKTGAVLMQMETRLVAIEKSLAEKKR